MICWLPCDSHWYRGYERGYDYDRIQDTTVGKGRKKSKTRKNNGINQLQLETKSKGSYHMVYIEYRIYKGVYRVVVV
jgi:hypothetical protein